VTTKPAKRDRDTELLAFEDFDFLMRDEMRSSRLALEFEKAELSLREQKIKSTIVIFGSSRARPRRGAGKAAKNAKGAQLGLWYEEARKFGRIVSERGGALAPIDGVRENVVTTGGGPGLMEAANRGAIEAGAPSIGFNIRLPAEQHPNAFITPGLSFYFHYFAIRKMHFAMRANALAVFPGGFGTLDELFEILTLKQTRKVGGMPVVLFCKDYWERIVDFSALAEFGTIDPQDLRLLDIVDSAEEGWQCMADRGLTLSTPLREV